jgi:hypothetical protein
MVFMMLHYRIWPLHAAGRHVKGRDMAGLSGSRFCARILPFLPLQLPYSSRQLMQSSHVFKGSKAKGRCLEEEEKSGQLCN